MINSRSCYVKSDGDEILGTFHQLGTKVNYDDSGQAYSITIAIVEGADGQMMTVEPHKVRFADRLLSSLTQFDSLEQKKLFFIGS